MPKTLKTGARLHRLLPWFVAAALAACASPTPAPSESPAPSAVPATRPAATGATPAATAPAATSTAPDASTREGRMAEALRNFEAQNAALLAPANAASGVPKAKKAPLKKTVVKPLPVAN
jgi:hypothetical protein